MKISTVLAAVLLATALALTGCATDVPTVATPATVTAPVATIAPAALTEAQKDQIFLAALDDQGIDYYNSDTIITIGHSIATLGEQGYTREQASQIFLQMNNSETTPPFTASECYYIVGAAFATYNG